MPVQIAKPKRRIPVVEPTLSEIKAIREAERTRATDSSLTIDELCKQLGL